MAGKLKLSMMIGDYEIVRALKDGTVKPKGIELRVADYPGTRAIHDKVAEGDACDINEFNGGAYVVQKHGGRDDFTALPVFLHRRFRHGFLFVNAAADIRAPKDLIGRQVGGTNLQPASNIWMRGILQDEYGLPHRQVTWVVERSEDVAFTPPKDLRIEMIAPGKKLDLMLAEGEIPAMLSPDLPRLFRAGDKRIVRLFPDYKDLELAYFRRTGIFPIMHVTTIKQEIVDKFPWVPTNLTKAFEAAKAIAYRRIANPRVVPLAWVRTALEEQEEMLGRDPWAYGLTPANRKNLETVLRYTFEQGMISKMLPLDALFADTDLGDAGGSDGI